MRGVRIPQDLNGEDQFVLGLSVTRLATLLFGLLAAYAVLHLTFPSPIRIGLAMLCGGLGAALAWVRPAGRSLGHWALAALEFHLASSLGERPRQKGTAGTTPSPRLSVVAPLRQPVNGSEVNEFADDDVIELPDPVAPVSAGRDPIEDASADDAVPVYLGGSQIITFFSSKGGTGRTTLATEVAILLARKGRYRPSAAESALPLRVILVDFDLSSANVSARLGLAQPTMLDYVADLTGGGADPEPGDYVVRHKTSNLDVLLGPPKCLAGDRSQLVGVPQAAHILSWLKKAGYHFILLDLGAAVGDLETYLLEATTQIYCVVTPTAGSIQSLYRGVEALRRLGFGEKLHYVANKMRDGDNLEEPMGDLGGTLVSRIPYDRDFDSAENRHQPLSLTPDGATRHAILQLASAIYPALEPPAAARTAMNPFTWLTRRRRAS
ncbi:MAG: AAA family ATPase [Candidatus Dormibacteraeota bacterium]|nr:AAA family ATPase [Candidatus Dormibacteraeota bacterium]